MTPIEKVPPPLFDEAPQRVCSRWIGNDNCGKEPFLHVLWSWETLENGIVCTEHAAELDKRWVYFQAHEVGPDCGMPGALWFRDENVCRCPDDDLEAGAAVEVVEAVAVRSGGAEK